MVDGAPSRPPPAQIPLELPLEPRFARAAFLPAASNVAALSAVDRWPDWPGRVLLLLGPPGSGKSHLTAIWAQKADAPVLSADGLPGVEELAQSGHRAFAVDGLERLRDETALFHLLNLVNENGLSLLLTARQPPREDFFRLPDLLSRIRRAPLVEIGAPDDELIRAVLEKLLRDRQLKFDPTLVAFLERRLERSLEAARAFVAELDRESLARGRPVTRALAAELLGGPQGDDET
jgi:chromosomal replication initiation ATPase DnaA